MLIHAVGELQGLNEIHEPKLIFRSFFVCENICFESRTNCRKILFVNSLLFFFFVKKYQ